MAAIAGTQRTFEMNGIREDLSDIIYNVDPTDTPFFNMAGKANATNVLHEWQTDTLATPDGDNAQLQGDEATFTTPAATTRLGNYTQISRKTVSIAGTNESVDKAGRDREMAYQTVKRTKELRRDMETIFLRNQARVAPADTTRSRLASVLSWINTNTSAGASGADPTGDGTDARTDGTQRAFTEALLKGVLQQCWDSGGDPECIMVGSFNKQTASGFTGGNTREENAVNKKVTASVDIYISDFGELRVIPNRFMRARDALVLQKDMWKVAYLRPLFSEELAKTGDAEKRQIITEYTLVSANEKASGAVFDLTTA